MISSGHRKNYVDQLRNYCRAFGGWTQSQPQVLWTVVVLEAIVKPAIYGTRFGFRGGQNDRRISRRESYLRATVKSAYARQSLKNPGRPYAKYPRQLCHHTTVSATERVPVLPPERVGFANAVDKASDGILADQLVEGVADELLLPDSATQLLQRLVGYKLVPHHLQREVASVSVTRRALPSSRVQPVATLCA